MFNLYPGLPHIFCIDENYLDSVYLDSVYQNMLMCWCTGTALLLLSAYQSHAQPSTTSQVHTWGLGSRLGTLTTINLLRSLSVICTVVWGGSTIMRSAVIVVTEAGTSVNLAVKVSFDSIIESLMIDIRKHCLGRPLVKGPRVIETPV